MRVSAVPKLGTPSRNVDQRITTINKHITAAAINPTTKRGSSGLKNGSIKDTILLRIFISLYKAPLRLYVMNYIEYQRREEKASQLHAKA